MLFKLTFCYPIQCQLTNPTEVISKSDEKIITTDFISRASLAYYLDPEEEYVLMRSRWRETMNDPKWKIWVINDDLIKKIEEQHFSGWAVIPPVTFQLVSAQTLDRYDQMMGQPVKQFPLGARPLNIYYLGSTNQ